MTVYTVHEPARGADEAVPEPERFRFVRDGFNFWAFLFAPLWMLWHRLWLVLVIYVVLTVGIQLGLSALGVSDAVRVAAAFLIALLVGFESGTLRRWSLGRRWSDAGIVVARNCEAAERRFFEAWTRETSHEGSAPHAGPPQYPVAPASPDVLGLFPQPAPRR